MQRSSVECSIAKFRVQCSSLGCSEAQGDAAYLSNVLCSSVGCSLPICPWWPGFGPEGKPFFWKKFIFYFWGITVIRSRVAAMGGVEARGWSRRGRIKGGRVSGVDAEGAESEGEN